MKAGRNNARVPDNRKRASLHQERLGFLDFNVGYVAGARYSVLVQSRKRFVIFITRNRLTYIKVIQQGLIKNPGNVWLGPWMICLRFFPML